MGVWIRTRYRKSGPTYSVVYRVGGRGAPTVHVGTFATATEAERWRDRIGLDLAAGRTAQPPRADGEQRVYLARLGDLVKIGVSIDPEARARRLNAELLATVAGGRDEELRLHRRFAVERVRGEWFQASPRILRCAELLALRGAA